MGGGLGSKSLLPIPNIPPKIRDKTALKQKKNPRLFNKIVKNVCLKNKLSPPPKSLNKNCTYYLNIPNWGSFAVLALRLSISLKLTVIKKLHNCFLPQYLQHQFRKTYMVDNFYFNCQEF